MKRLSELEGAVLGIVRQRGPLTAYAIRREFEGSASSHWSGSAGAIYPLVLRLVARGLLWTQRQPARGRAASTCRLTPLGGRALLRWLGPPLPDWAAAVTFDPIRTRMSFFGALTPALRRRLLADAERRLLGELARARQLALRQKAAGARWEALATRGAVEEIRGRLRWARKVRALLA